MLPRHISTETVRAYLLGTLDRNAAAALEDEYFAAPALFTAVLEEERWLILEYLDGGLPPDQRLLFEARYLEIPELRRRLERVKTVRSAALRKRATTRMAVAAGFLLVLGSVTWILRETRQNALTGERSGSPPSVETVTFRLIRGLPKSGEGQRNRFAAPPTGSVVQLILERPGPETDTATETRIKSVGADGGTTPVWKGPCKPAENPSTGRQDLVALVPSGKLVPGDYIAESLFPGGAVSESYYFRITPVQ
jgi:hypothetical protein